MRTVNFGHHMLVPFN